MANDLIASMVLAIWFISCSARGGFWLGRERDDNPVPGADPSRGMASWPAVTAVIPARDEAESVGEPWARCCGRIIPAR